MAELLLRAVLGGVIVSAFAVVGEVWKPNGRMPEGEANRRACARARSAHDRHMRSPVTLGLAGLLAAALLVSAGTAEAGVPGVIINSARTVAHGVRDGALTLARTTHAFVVGGPEAAEDTWHDNVELTREHARRNADRVVAEAGLEREPSHDDDYDHDYDPSRSYPPAPDDDH